MSCYKGERFIKILAHFCDLKNGSSPIIFGFIEGLRTYSVHSLFIFLILAHFFWVLAHFCDLKMGQKICKNMVKTVKNGVKWGKIGVFLGKNGVK